jgi:tyrosine-specific transport protein
MLSLSSNRPQSSSPVEFWVFVGGVLMIVGTAIGGGMLALPVVTAAGGFYYSLIFLSITWLFTTLGAFYLLEANLYLPEGSNLISMAEGTLGRFGKGLTWLCYLILLYSLLSAYIAGGGEILSHLIGFLGFTLSSIVGSFVFIFIFLLILIRGMSAVDKANRLIMGLKISSYFFILFLTLFHVDLKKLSFGNPVIFYSAMTTMITSFGFSIIIPSLRSYFKGHVRSLKWAVFIGSLIPLLFYILWEFAIFGVVSSEGKNGLLELSHSSHPVVSLVNALTQNIDSHGIVFASNLFTMVCVFTAFLGVSTSFIHFLSDALKFKKEETKYNLIYLFAFIPPFLCVLFLPSVFKFCLNFAGIICVLLLIMLPAMMVWNGRYRKKYVSTFVVFGGKPLILCLILACIVALFIGFFQLSFL